MKNEYTQGKKRWVVELTPEQAKNADDWFKAQGISRTEAVHRIMQWALSQGDEMRLEILGQIPDSMRDRVILEAMCDLVSDANAAKAHDILHLASQRSPAKSKRRSSSGG